MVYHVFLFFVVLGCGGDSEEEKEVPTTAEVNQAIQDANYCSVDADCGYVDSCFCGDVANVNELEELQSLVEDWKEGEKNSAYCSTTDCVAYLPAICEAGKCMAVEDDGY